MDRVTGDARINELLALLQHRVPEEREQAALLLGTPRNERAIEPLIEALGDDAAIVRARAAQSLGEIGAEGATQALIGRLVDPDVHVRIEAALALGRIDGTDMEEPLIAIIRHKDEAGPLRAAALTALGLTKERAERHLAVLLEAAEDVNAEVQQAAIETLRYIDDDRVTDVFIELLDNRFDTSNNGMMDVVSILGERKNVRAVAALTRILLVDHMVYRELAAEALGKIGDPHTLPALERVLQDTRPEDDPRFYPHLVKTIRKAIAAIKATGQAGSK